MGCDVIEIGNLKWGSSDEVEGITTKNKFLQVDLGKFFDLFHVMYLLYFLKARELPC
jgi:hypothetical protein